MKDSFSTCRRTGNARVGGDRRQLDPTVVEGDAPSEPGSRAPRDRIVLYALGAAA